MSDWRNSALVECRFGRMLWARWRTETTLRCRRARSLDQRLLGIPGRSSIRRDLGPGLGNRVRNGEAGRLVGSEGEDSTNDKPATVEGSDHSGDGAKDGGTRSVVRLDGWSDSNGGGEGGMDCAAPPLALRGASGCSGRVAACTSSSPSARFEPGGSHPWSPLPDHQKTPHKAGLFDDGGEGGIRTHEGLSPLLVFKTSAFNRSATSPCLVVELCLNRRPPSVRIGSDNHRVGHRHDFRDRKSRRFGVVADRLFAARLVDADGSELAAPLAEDVRANPANIVVHPIAGFCGTCRGGLQCRAVGESVATKDRV